MSNDAVEVSKFEAEALSIISEILSCKVEYRLERRAESYLTLVVGEYDFCRLKATERTNWISFDMWRCSDSVKNDERLKDVSNKNQRHWKIRLPDIHDIRNYSDILVASFDSCLAVKSTAEIN